MTADPLVMPLARELLDCYAVEIDKVRKSPKKVGLRTGNVVNLLLSLNEDECCSGLAWVRPAGFFPSSDVFPQQDASPIGQQGPGSWAVTLELGAARCVSTGTARSLPSEATWDEATQAVMDDAAAMRRALCCFAEGPRPGGLRPRGWSRVLPGMWQPLPVEGGCVGGTMLVTVRRSACDCPRES